MAGGVGVPKRAPGGIVAGKVPVVALTQREYDWLNEIEWRARDFVWSCPNPPEHPTYDALVKAFANERL